MPLTIPSPLRIRLSPFGKCIRLRFSGPDPRSRAWQRAAQLILDHSPLVFKEPLNYFMEQ